MYTLEFAPQALEDLSKLKKSEPAAFKKAGKLLVELQEHPKTGTGKPEPLSGKDWPMVQTDLTKTQTHLRDRRYRRKSGCSVCLRAL